MFPDADGGENVGIGKNPVSRTGSVHFSDINMAEQTLFHFCCCAVIR